RRVVLLTVDDADHRWPSFATQTLCSSDLSVLARAMASP
ncbi:hypothetical protein ACNJT3_21155, partial [Mycobacterium tuberculosis]